MKRTAKHQHPVPQAGGGRHLEWLPWRWLWGLIFGVAAATAGLAAAGGAESRFAGAYERELAGALEEAAAGYRELLETAGGPGAGLGNRLLYRLGVCEWRLGHAAEARATWRRLADASPADDRFVAQARETLKALEREADRVTLAGRVLAGQGAAPAFLHVGEWGREPVLAADAAGQFQAVRRAAGRRPDGARYGLVYAEHVTQPAVAAEVCLAPAGVATCAVELVLQPAVEVAGRVLDSRRRPVAGAALRVMGFKEVAGDLVPMPFDRILPPVLSQSNGQYRITGLVPGLRYRLTAVLAGYRLTQAAEVVVPATPAGALTAGDVVLDPLGEVMLRGRVVDESGKGVATTVAAWSLPPVERELARVTTDDSGRFFFRELQETLVTLRVEDEAYEPRQVAGVKPMGQDLDIVVKACPGAPGPGTGGAMRETGDARATPRRDFAAVEEGPSAVALPEFDMTRLRWLRGNPETGEAPDPRALKGQVVVYHFGSAYMESSLRAEFPGEPGILSVLLRLFGARGVTVVWVLSRDEAGDDAARLALQLYPDLPVAVAPVDYRLPHAVNRVVDRDGSPRFSCTDLQAISVVKILQ